MTLRDDQLSAQLVNSALPVGTQAQQEPLWMHAATAYSLPQMMANTARRGSNTIIQGGRSTGWFGTGFRERVPGTKMGRIWQEHRNPFRRFTDQDIFFNNPAGKGAAAYTPFNTFGWGNNFMNALAGNSNTKIGSLMGKIGAGRDWQTKLATNLQQNGDFFQQGMLSRIVAGSRIERMSSGTLANALTPGAERGNLLSFLSRSGFDTDLITNPASGWTQKQAASYATYASAGRVGSFIGAARIGLVEGTEAYTNAMNVAGGNTAAQWGTRMAGQFASDLKLGANYTARQAAGKLAGRTVSSITGRSAGQAIGRKVALKGAGKAAVLLGAKIAGLFAGPLAVISAALLAYDVAKLAGMGVGKVASFGAEAFKSYTRGARTGILQQRFTDNEVTATSRSRGVAAISASRLNARSILGNEGYAMASHFG